MSYDLYVHWSGSGCILSEIPVTYFTAEVPGCRALLPSLPRLQEYCAPI